MVALSALLLTASELATTNTAPSGSTTSDARTCGAAGQGASVRGVPGCVARPGALPAQLPAASAQASGHLAFPWQVSPSAPSTLELPTKAAPPSPASASSPTAPSSEQPHRPWPRPSPPPATTPHRVELHQLGDARHAHDADGLVHAACDDKQWQAVAGRRTAWQAKPRAAGRPASCGAKLASRAARRCGAHALNKHGGLQRRLRAAPEVTPT